MEKENQSYTDFGYELIRDTLLPELLGKEHSEILYWGGKALARNFPLESIDEIKEFFVKAGWGEVHILKEKKSEILIELELPHLAGGKKASFDRHLEAGFLAEQLERLTSCPAETFITDKKTKVLFEVHWDPKDHFGRETRKTRKKSSGS